MKVLLLDKIKITTLLLPISITGNYSVNNSKNKNVINIEAIDNKWILKSNSDIVIYKNGDLFEQVELTDYSSFILKNRIDTKAYILYVFPYYDPSFLRLELKGRDQFLIGNNNKNNNNYTLCQISFGRDNISSNQIKIEKNGSKYRIENLDLKNDMYVNGSYCNQAMVSSGDFVFISGISFIMVRNTIVINNYDNTMSYDTNCLSLLKPYIYDSTEIEEINKEFELQKEAFFLRPPRIQNHIEEKTIVIDSPPQEIKKEDTPAIFTLGPMLIMSVSSVVTASFTIIKLTNGEQLLKDALPSLIISFVMIIGSVLFPTIQKKYTDKQKIKKEDERKKKYYAYLNKKKEEITKELLFEEQVLNQNFIPLNGCADIILNDKKNLWERKITSDDFLELRIGTGYMPALFKVNYEQEKFTMDEDPLKKDMFDLVNSTNYLQNVPITESLTEDYISAIIGEENVLYNYLDGLLLQLITFHGYDNLKIVVFVNNKNKTYWSKLKNTPYCFNDDKSFRLYGDNLVDIGKVSNYLDELLSNRIESTKDKSLPYSAFGTYYLILTDCIEDIRKTEIIAKILKLNNNYGMGILMLSDNFNLLPSECKKIIDLNMLLNPESKEVTYRPDMINFDISECLLRVSNIPLEISDIFRLPQSVSFLEMYNVGNVNQLNSPNRWKLNDPSQSLRAPIGIGDNNELFYLDLHEKMHGPHGLIAGMTGSGKSELIISYILSMAVNYSPEEVTFVIIDYKGGGLAGAFENRETGIRLPHLVGTITNLDEIDMKRSLASIQSELKRRQDVFNTTRNALAENTMDIYKYQRLHREGKIKEAMPHLFIVSDEFAELKAQQPDFMDQLISAARIGRSLGVHLILATQKPSGIVNDQIWSNSKFKICLKVQDKSDSVDMIQRPDAAALKQVGRFYLLVGYNDYFSEGQSAWSGAQYYEQEKRSEIIDTDVQVIDNVGEIVSSLPTTQKKNIGVFKGEELKNVLEYIINLAKKENISLNKLWLDRIEPVIFLDKLRTKYNYQANSFVINPVIGEYDNPSKQLQDVVKLELSKNGNTIIFGAAGSGKDLLLSTIVFSSIIDHTVDEINFYFLDFGSEALKVFKDAPQVGGIVLSQDEEKVKNLFKLLNKIINDRKELLSTFAGDFEEFVKGENHHLPLVVVIINNYDAFKELYDLYSDILIKLSREGNKYGVVFILTATSTNSIRYRLSQNFKNVISMQQNDKYEYTNIFGNTNGTYPSKIVGRGLIKVDDICEFQTAYVIEKKQFNKYVNEFCQNLAKTSDKKALPVPTLPDVVKYDFISKFFTGMDQIPVGIERESLNPSIINLEKQNLIISSLEQDTSYCLTNNINKFIASLKLNNLFIFDGSKNKKLSLFTKNYIQSNFIGALQVIEKYLNNCMNNQSSTRIILEFNNYTKIFTLFTDEEKTLYENVLKLGEKTEKLSVIIVDTAYSIKQVEYDNLFKMVNNNSQGIFIGQGSDQQYTIKINMVKQDDSASFDRQTGYVVKNGMQKVVKFIGVLDEK